MKNFILAFIFIAWRCVLADVYLHNPRGSNNRLDESERGTKNNKRLFDSQNNARGGYNVGGLVYYSQSQLQLEWTNQHSCQSPNNNCEIILQYMCGESTIIRDGASSETIPLLNGQCENNNCEQDLKFGMHENYLYYQHCRSQERNKGLFTANQKLAGDSALFTRQNSAGTRFGFECPEERDYYPYWRSTPWKDIAILTNNVSRCPYYQQESENVNSRWTCELPKEVLNDLVNRKLTIPQTREACESFIYPPNTPTGKKGVWTEFPSHGLPPPECRETEYTRDNHLGNTLDGNHFGYTWSLPNVDNQRCVLRIRYNISTGDFDGWDSSINFTLNKDKIPLANLNPKWDLRNEGVDLSQKGYVLQNNPQVQIFPELDLKLQLTINPAQYGRVFEDRSHTFGIIPKPKNGIDSKSIIHNLNVRGKRGNIVQVYPAVEYDFVPQILEVSRGDYIHIQWIGSNTNPKDNTGEGLAGTDRSNLVPLMDLLVHQPQDTFGHWGRSYPLSLNQINSFLDLNTSDLEMLAYLRPGLVTGSVSNLDDAGTYFNLGLRQVNQPGTYNFLCTRNNNFSNRNQKGRIIVSDCAFKTFKIGGNGGNITLGSTIINVQEGTFPNLVKLRLEEWTSEEVRKAKKLKSIQSRIDNNLVSNVIVIEPESCFVSNSSSLTKKSESIQLQISINEHPEGSTHLYRTSVSDASIWQRMDAQIKNGVVIFQTDRGGVYLVQTHQSSSMIVAAIVVPLILLLLAIAICVYFARNKEHWIALKNIGKNTQRSMQNNL